MNNADRPAASVRSKPRIAADVTGALILVFAIGVSVTIWLMANSTSIPLIALDEWVVGDTITSEEFWSAVCAGHNSAPTWAQNLLWRLDFDWLNYERRLPHWFQNLGFMGGLVLLFLAVRLADLDRARLAWFAAVFLLLWFSVNNSAHYGSWYVWRGVEGAGIFF
jgi:hypothetical protein